MPEGVDWKDVRKVMSPLGNSPSLRRSRACIAFVASDDCRYMMGCIVSIDGGITDLTRRVRDMITTTPGSLWELIERRAAATPDRAMLHRRATCVR